MKLGIVIYSSDSETVWNAFRFGNFALAMGDEVRVFLIGKGVEADLLDTDTFKANEQLETFINGSGKIFVCGTCLEIHQLEPSEKYVVSTLKDLYEIVEESDKVITF